MDSREKRHLVVVAAWIPVWVMAVFLGILLGDRLSDGDSKSRARQVMSAEESPRVYPAVIQRTEWSRISDGDKTYFRVVQLDGCEYVQAYHSGEASTAITHKGDCHNQVHRQKP